MINTKEIRKQMKEELGYNARQVSISYDYIAVTFTIRDANVNYKEVEKFSKQFENIYRDDFSGEILSGGNTFVNVYFSDEVEEIMSTEYLSEVNEATIQIEDNSLIPVKGTDFLVGRSSNGNWISLWKDGHILEAYNEQRISFEIAKLIGMKKQTERKQMPEEKQNKIGEGFIDEFKGNKIFCIQMNERQIFSFGLKKAAAILDNIDKIKEFVETYGK